MLYEFSSYHIIDFYGDIISPGEVFYDTYFRIECLGGEGCKDQSMDITVKCGHFVTKGAHGRPVDGNVRGSRSSVNIKHVFTVLAVVISS